MLWHWRLETDRELFAKVVFPAYCDRPFNRMHRERFALEKVPCTRARAGVKRVKAAPRGNAKSTIDGFVDLVHDIVYAFEWFILIISDTASLSTDRVKDIKAEIESNEFLRWVYGDLVPKGDGVTWTQTELVTANGVKVLASSMGKSVRGIKNGAWRPTKVVLDDAEDSDNVRSPLQRKKAQDFLTKDILKVGASYTVYEFIGTVLHPESLLAKALAGAEGVGGWTPSFYQAIEQWPERMDLWEQFGAIAVDITNPDHEADALAFYEANRAEMDRGAKVLWPEHEPLVALMLMRFYDGLAAFNSEKQNQPYDPETQLWNYDEAGKFEIVRDAAGVDWVVRSDGHRFRFDELEVFAFLDSAMAKTKGSDTAAIAVVGRHKPTKAAPSFYVLEVWVKRKPPSVQIEALFDINDRWYPTKVGVEINGFQALLKGDINRIAQERAASGAQNWKIPIYGVTQHQNKLERISKLEPKVSHKWVWFANDLPTEAVDQLTQFPTHKNDDVPDAIEGAIAIAGGRQVKAEVIAITLFG
jgi:predicted phage terminase large subunit-like protein